MKSVGTKYSRSSSCVTSDLVAGHFKTFQKKLIHTFVADARFSIISHSFLVDHHSIFFPPTIQTRTTGNSSPSPLIRTNSVTTSPPPFPHRYRNSVSVFLSSHPNTQRRLLFTWRRFPFFHKLHGIIFIILTSAISTILCYSTNSLLCIHCDGGYLFVILHTHKLYSIELSLCLSTHTHTHTYTHTHTLKFDWRIPKNCILSKLTPKIHFLDHCQTKPDYHLHITAELFFSCSHLFVVFFWLNCRQFLISSLHFFKINGNCILYNLSQSISLF